MKIKTISSRRKLALTISSLLISCFVFSQEIKFKDSLVIIDGNECFKIREYDTYKFSILDLEGQEIIILELIEHRKYDKRLYNKITFVNSKIYFTTRYLYTRRTLIKKLLDNDVISHCKLIPKQVEKFAVKFDEGLEKKLKQ